MPTLKDSAPVCILQKASYMKLLRVNFESTTVFTSLFVGASKEYEFSLFYFI
jgi:hypothetical protein